MDKPNANIFGTFLEQVNQVGEAAQIRKQLTEVYQDRNLLAQLVGKLAQRSGIEVKWGIDSDNPDWPVLFIELPEVGQVSWHISNQDTFLPADSGGVWDHHTNADKEGRIKRFLVGRPIGGEQTHPKE
jgi:hypothetical protein